MIPMDFIIKLNLVLMIVAGVIYTTKAAMRPPKVNIIDKDRCDIIHSLTTIEHESIYAQSIRHAAAKANDNELIEIVEGIQFQITNNPDMGIRIFGRERFEFLKSIVIK